MSEVCAKQMVLTEKMPAVLLAGIGAWPAPQTARVLAGAVQGLFLHMKPDE